MLRQGSIVWVNLEDQAGRNPKCRPAVVVTPTDEIVEGESIVVVATVGTFSKPLPDNRVPLPWHRDRHPTTGLYKECVAVCDWLLEIDQVAVISVAGHCPRATLDRILTAIPRE